MVVLVHAAREMVQEERCDPQLVRVRELGTLVHHDD